MTTTTRTPAKATYSVAQAAAYLELGESTVRAMIRAGEVPHYRLGGSIRIPGEYVEAFSLVPAGFTAHTPEASR